MSQAADPEPSLVADALAAASEVSPVEQLALRVDALEIMLEQMTRRYLPRPVEGR